MPDRLTDDRVSVTFFLITYNQERYIREAIEGAFSQTYAPLEIVISDDCSTDGTFRIIEEMCEKYDGSHNIVVNRNTENLGVIAHINRITDLSSGELIICAAGDDISLPHRTEKVVERYLATGRRASLIHSSVYLIDREGNRVGTRLPPLISQGMTIEEIALSDALFIGATIAYTRKIEEMFGTIKYSKCFEDLVMGFRSALAGSLEYISEPMLLYRYESGISACSTLQNEPFNERIAREIRHQEMYLAVMAQRLVDLERIGNDELQPLVKNKRAAVLLKRKVWMGNYRFLRLLSYSTKRGYLGLFLSLLLRKKKRGIIFSINKVVFKSAIN
ncbi:MAG: glycosyltransferase [Chlorobium sp.]|nr:MAG: glycosyltransferase [Chlorobium sp.]